MKLNNVASTVLRFMMKCLHPQLVVPCHMGVKALKRANRCCSNPTTETGDGKDSPSAGKENSRDSSSAQHAIRHPGVDGVAVKDDSNVQLMATSMAVKKPAVSRGGRSNPLAKTETPNMGLVVGIP